MKSPTSEEKLMHLLLERLERISVDSYWAHQASGVRSTLLHDLESEPRLRRLIELGFHILEDAVHEKVRMKGSPKRARNEIG